MQSLKRSLRYFFIMISSQPVVDFLLFFLIFLDMWILISIYGDSYSCGEGLLSYIFVPRRADPVFIEVFKDAHTAYCEPATDIDCFVHYWMSIGDIHYAMKHHPEAYEKFNPETVKHLGNYVKMMKNKLCLLDSFLKDAKAILSAEDYQTLKEAIHHEVTRQEEWLLSNPKIKAQITCMPAFDKTMYINNPIRLDWTAFDWLRIYNVGDETLTALLKAKMTMPALKPEVADHSPVPWYLNWVYMAYCGVVLFIGIGLTYHRHFFILKIKLWAARLISYIKGVYKSIIEKYRAHKCKKEERKQK